MVSPLDLGATTKTKKPVVNTGAKPKLKTRLPPLDAAAAGKAPPPKMLDPKREEEKRGKTRSRSRSPAPVAHNRFHYNCCDGKKANSVDDIKAQSLQNVAKRRKSRLNGNGITNGMYFSYVSLKKSGSLPDSGLFLIEPLAFRVMHIAQ